MSDHERPWGGPPPWHADKRFRLLLWLGLLLLVGGGVWELFRLFPGQVSSSWDVTYLVRGLVIVAVLSAAVVRAKHLNLMRTLRHVAIWGVLVVVLALGFTFRSELDQTALRVRSEFVPAYPVTTGSHTMVLTESADDNFYVIGQVNGAPVRFLIDTGASDIVLSPADAARLGVDLSTLRFSRAYETANGVGGGAPYKASSLSVGPIQLSDVAMSVNRAPMPSSLLGMTFFKQLESFEIKDRTLTLKWKS